MLKKLGDYLRLVLVIVGVLMGVQVPSIMDQYAQRIDAHYLESEESLNMFRDEADRFFDGDFSQLIAHYAGLDDPVIQAGGESLSALYARNEYLKGLSEKMKASWPIRFFATFLTPDADISHEVWEHYSYTVPLDRAGILWGVLAAFLSVGFFDLSAFLVRLLILKKWLPNKGQAKVAK